MEILYKRTVSLLILTLLLLSQPLVAEPIAVIINADNNEEIDIETIKSIYSDRKSFWENGKKIIVFELPVTSIEREKFSQALFNKSAISSQSDWFNRRINNTLKNNVKIKSHKLVTKFISLRPSAIGYVPVSAIKDIKNIKIIMTIE